jgi:phytoene dehydrogenase-like protein
LSALDAVVIGSGPNGLAAAVTLAQAGRSVLVLEAGDTVGGGARSKELTLSGFVHDVCSAIHPMAVGSSFFRSLPLAAHGLEWIFPPADVAHPLDDGTAVVLSRSFEATGQSMEGRDGEAWRSLIEPYSRRADALLADLLSPHPLSVPRHPFLKARFGLRALGSAGGLARRAFRGERARGFFAGLAAHAIQPLESPFTATFGLLFGILGHAYGWPLPRGGSQSIPSALASLLGSLGGRIETGRRISRFEEIPAARAVLFDLSPRHVAAIAGARLGRYRRALESFQYGPAAFKVDYALSAPIPWKARGCAQAATVHLGGTLDEIAASERACAEGRAADRPFVLLAQQSLFDPSRAPAGKHTAWAYCHVPRGSAEDFTPKIDAQIERFAPGFRDLILARSVLAPADLEAYNPNYVGGDIACGSTAFPQLLLRPGFRLDLHSTPDRSIYICSSATPPGAGVHGLCGHFAARSALARVLQRP